MKYGYARVSMDGQSIAAQVAQLNRAGCKKVFRETASGAKTDRAELRKALAALAEFETEFIRAHSGEGRSHAVARGVKMGRKPKLTARQRKEALRRVDAGERTRDIARSYNVSHSTIRG